MSVCDDGNVLSRTQGPAAPFMDVEEETGALEVRILGLCAIVEFCLLCCWVFARSAYIIRCGENRGAKLSRE